MKNQDAQNGAFTNAITKAADCLRFKDFEEAYRFIIEAMRIEPDAPQPHNLLGIWFELKGNSDKARKHYRAAYSLDPTFKPACKNLEQICMVFDSRSDRTYDFGDERDEPSGIAASQHWQF